MQPGNRSHESVEFDEGLEQDWAVAIEQVPILWEFSCGEAQDGRGEVVAAHPGQDEETGVVGDQMQATLSLFASPADKAVARLGLPGAGAKAEQGDKASLGPYEVA